MLVKNIKGNNWVDISDLGLFIHYKELPESPEIAVVDTDTISHRRVLLEVGYTHREMTVELAVVRYSKEDLRSVLTDIGQLFKGSFDLIFKSNKAQVYKDVVLSSKIEVDEVTDSVVIIKLYMTAYDPFRYSRDYNVTNFALAKRKTTKIIKNRGNHKAKPIVTLSGKASQVDITVNGKTLSYVDLVAGENVVIDNKHYTVKKDGESALANWRDNFIELEPGDNTIIVSGSGMAVNVEIKFEDTFL